MNATYILKPGELTLKGGNRQGFERILVQNLRKLLALRGLGGAEAQVQGAGGRFFVRCPPEAAPAAEDALDHLFGISGWARTRICEKTVESLFAACVAEGEEACGRGARSFKIEARRTDKSFPLDSYGICAGAGEAVREAVPGLLVEVHSPQALIQVEIRDRAYVYSMTQAGLRGLPVGTAGRGLLLLSGGIDSPAAGFKMASRGMGLDAVHFHAFPYTGEEARQKVIRLAGIVGAYTLGIRLWILGFTEVQRRIKAGGREEWATVMLRMAMMEAAEKLARRTGAKCLVTGDSLSQVASQTLENLSCAESLTQLPVLRPLIGTDKEEIVRLARSIGTYETSILPYEDCCVLFSPAHPVLRGGVDEARDLYRRLDLAGEIDRALAGAVVEKCGFTAPGAKAPV
ncbi:MAG: tRNA 4-thiouridine(8) synthase ThiI [Treponema sp.]|jgi:thiamine biosynthesis protein ThiI|nr:tRNA 4-thiouridine(8) synthase ThiI [Treponema sp.]